MKTFRTLLSLGFLSLLIVGCGGQADRPKDAPASSQPTATGDSEVRASLAKLSPEDRKIAEAQKYCAVESENLLGSMDKPVKIMVKDQPVFLCCKGCKKRALADPDKTIATVNELKKKSKDVPTK